MATALGYSTQFAAFYHFAHAVGHHASSIVMSWQRLTKPYLTDKPRVGTLYQPDLIGNSIPFFPKMNR